MNPPGQPLLVFQLDAQRCALHLAAARRVLPMMAIEPLPGAPPVISGVINVAGQVLPVLDARRRFGLRARPPRLADVLILVDTRTRSFALAADGVVGLVQHEPGSVTPAAALSPQVPHVAGVAKLDDGLALIHDVDTFLAAAEEAQLADALADAFTHAQAGARADALPGAQVDAPGGAHADAPAGAPAGAYADAPASAHADAAAGAPPTGEACR